MRSQKSALAARRLRGTTLRMRGASLRASLSMRLLGDAMQSETVGPCTLYLADYRQVLPLLQGVTAVVADPPYGEDYRPKGSRDKVGGPGTTPAASGGNAGPF